MAVTRACANCGRVLSVIGEGCCYVCYHAGKGLAGTAKDDARAAVKEKIESGGLKSRGGGRRGPRPKERIAPIGLPVPAVPPAPSHPVIHNDEHIAPARVVEGTPIICIDFTDERDRKIYDALIGAAHCFRRTPEQQILWMVQDAMARGAGFLVEASGK